MDRLTGRTHSGSPDIMFSRYPNPRDLMIEFAKLYSKLCEYEDTGLEPSEINDMRTCIDKRIFELEQDLDHYKQLEAAGRDIPKETIPKTENRGMDVSGEYDIDFMLLCPVCKTVVGDCEANELYYNFCPECGQKLSLPPDEDEEADAVEAVITEQKGKCIVCGMCFDKETPYCTRIEAGPIVRNHIEQ